MPSVLPTAADEHTARTRAAAMPRSERRAALVETTLSLLLEHGAGVTTRQIAEAAGVAEGTIFRVFEDKDQLLDAVADRVFDPGPAQRAIEQIDRSLPLEARLAAAVDILQRRVADVWRFMTAVGMPKPAERHRRTNDAPEMKELASLIAPDQAKLRRDASQVAQLLRSMTFACSHPALTSDPLPAEEIVSVLLDGIRLSEPETP